MTAIKLNFLTWDNMDATLLDLLCCSENRGSLGIAVVEPYLGGAMNAVKCGDILRSATR
jgi:hypothetical protein